MDIRDCISDEPIVDAIRRAAPLDEAWQPYVDKLVDFAEFLQREVPAKRIYGFVDHHVRGPMEMLLSGSEHSVLIWADTADGASQFPDSLYIRMQIRRPDAALTEDVRTKNMHEAVRHVRETLNI
ncbi:MAG: hypothetical protein DWQ37_04685 [Planctomycetota bacterium]|nr:MAG: hypothetical protein DWQ37_04685 [Planctomycetota bacterium]